MRKSTPRDDTTAEDSDGPLPPLVLHRCHVSACRVLFVIRVDDSMRLFRPSAHQNSFANIRAFDRSLCSPHHSRCCVARICPGTHWYSCAIGARVSQRCQAGPRGPSQVRNASWSRLLCPHWHAHARTNTLARVRTRAHTQTRRQLTNQVTNQPIHTQGTRRHCMFVSTLTKWSCRRAPMQPTIRGLTQTTVRLKEAIAGTATLPGAIRAWW